jgi:hypothetical protein
MVKETDIKLNANQCEKSNKYKKADIIAIAKNLGVEVNPRDTRKQICDKIMSILDSSKLGEPTTTVVQANKSPKTTQMKKFTKSSLKAMKKAELVSLIKKLDNKISIDGTKPVLIERILQIQSSETIRKTPTRSPTRSPTRAPTPVIKKCFGGLTMKQLMSKKVNELRDTMNKAGIESKGLKKQEMAEYLCAHDKKCEGTCEYGLVCDINNAVCISPALADKKIKLKDSKYIELSLDGKRVVGTKTAIDTLKSKMKTEIIASDEVIEERVSPSPRIAKKPADTEIIASDEIIEERVSPSPRIAKKPADGEEIIIVEDKLPSPKKPKPTDGTEIIDVEEILRQIQVGDGEEISELAETQKAVLKCLGLLA